MTSAPAGQMSVDEFVSGSQLAAWLQLWRDLLDQERTKSPRLPILWGQRACSQNDEDGIVQEIFARIGIASRTCLEIGVGNGLENNTLYWLKQGWRGVWIEGSGAHVSAIGQAFAPAIAKGRLQVRQALVSAENVNQLVAATPLLGREIDLLSIDIDGNDYYVFQSLEAVRPRVVIIEYNALYTPPVRWRIPYNPAFAWDGSDWYGASLQSLHELFGQRGYTLVACNVTGSNAFFVRQDLVADRFPLAGDVGALYQPPRPYLTLGLFYRLMVLTRPSPQLDAIWE